MTDGSDPDADTDGDSDPTPGVDGDVQDRVVELAKRRGFFFRTAGAYGGVSGFYTFGPQGAALKSNVEDAWRRRFTVREGNVEIDSPTVMPEAVFEASGHLDGFDDMLVECAECGASHRADHVVEDATDVEEAESLAPEAVAELIADHDLACPACGTALAGRPVEEFNLMFGTNIGPGSSSPGYLRPETAQGIFVEFPRLSEYARGQLPFGVTQIGRAYRNEISPRRSIVRVREFTQAELELFVHPEDGGPDLSTVADRTLPLYPAAAQEAGEGVRELTVREAVDGGVVADPWIAYYLGVAAEWYDSVGVDMDRFRFRQHLGGELAHYAADCWDAESRVGGVLDPGGTEDHRTATSSGGDWIELAGFAYRGDYDLSKHAQHSEGRFTVFEQYDEPRTVERPTVDPDMSYLGPEYGGAAADVADAVEALVERDPSAFEGEAVTVEVDGEAYEVPVEATGFAVEETTEAGEHVRPHVVEPSFGIDRLVYTLLDHNYREDTVDGEARTYLALDPSVAPTFVGVFPLLNDPEMEDRARGIAADLRAAGLSVTYDDSGNIGRRYRRQDEVGTPFCVTVDHDTAADDTVTVRDRDTTEQVRVPVDDLAGTLSALRAGERSFDDLA
jgi:glycyl-tRNA synthetase